MKRVALRALRIGVVGGLVCVLIHAPPVLAQSRADPPLGASWQSSPGYYRIPVVAAAEPGVNLAAGFGYGYTESQSAAPGSHHRLEGRLAASLEPLPGLGLAFGTNLRHDQHADDALGTDQGTVIDSDIHAQLGTRVGREFHLGGALGAAFTRGPTLGNSLENPAIDVSFLGAYVPLDAPFSAGLLAGFRYDRTARVARDPALYRAGDRLSLELSQFDAVLLGLGASYRINATELLAELSGDVLVGTGAPAFDQSPLRVTIGARQRLGERFSVRLTTDTALSARPPAGPLDPLVPIEPRFQVLAALAYHWLGTPPEKPAGIDAEPGARREPALPAPSSLEVKVTTLDGDPLSDASVEIVDGERTISVPHQSLATYRLDSLTPGEVTLRVSAARLETHSQRIVLAPGTPLRVAVKLAATAATGQLRGLVRSFNGSGLRARVRIEPLGTEVQTDAAGTFQADVPPGKYDVVVEAPGHRAQRRHVEVAADGVVILNADLSKGPK